MPEVKDYTPRLKTHYDDVVRSALIEKFAYANPMLAPRLEKVVLNMGVGEAVGDTKKVKSAVGARTLISGQQPAATPPTKSIANACTNSWIV